METVGASTGIYRSNAMTNDYIYILGALIYRVIPPRNESHKLKLKLGHAGTMLLAFILMVIGLQVASELL